MAGHPQTAAPATPSALEQVLRRDRAVVISAILIIAAIAWAYTVYLAETGMGDGMSMGMAMADMRSWSVTDFALMFVMWAVMMVAMMAPSTAPMLLMFASLNRKRREREAPYLPTAVFLAGYVIVWTVFAAAATGGNWGLHQASLLSSMMGASTSGYLGGALLSGGWSLSMEPAEVRLPQAVPHAHGVPDDILARGASGCPAHGAGARRLLPRLLLVPDAAALRAGRDELGLDRRPCRLRSGREGRADGRVGQPRNGRLADRLGHLGHSYRRAVKESHQARQKFLSEFEGRPDLSPLRIVN